MPQTPKYKIPYVAPSDAQRNYPATAKAAATATETAISALDATGIYRVTPKGVVADIDEPERKWRIRVDGKNAIFEGTVLLDRAVKKNTTYEIGTFPAAVRSTDSFVGSPTCILSGKLHYVLIYPSEGRIEIEPTDDVTPGSKINFNQFSWRIAQ